MIAAPLATLLLLLPQAAPAPRPAAPQAAEEGATGSIESINRQFQEKLQELERARLSELAALADRLDGDEADRVLEVYLRDALGAGLSEEAEPVAERLIEAGTAPPTVRYLAEVVNVMAEADRGSFEESLESIVAAVDARRAAERQDDGASELALPVSARISLLDAYYQRLAQAGQYAIARRAFATILEGATDPQAQEYLTSRIAQLDLVGRPAPSFSGTDLDGRPIRLEDLRGRAVLLNFWATWHEPTVEQADWVKDSYAGYRDRGLVVVGVDVDALADGGRPAEQVLPEVRRYVLQNNLPWPILVDTPQEGSIAGAYGVTQIPANVLIGPDGNVRHLEVNPVNVEQVLDEVLAE